MKNKFFLNILISVFIISLPIIVISQDELEPGRTNGNNTANKDIIPNAPVLIEPSDDTANEDIIIAPNPNTDSGLTPEQETALAQEAEQDIEQDEDIKASDLGVGNPSILPNSYFYFLKNWKRGIQNLITRDPLKKAELKLKIANEKLIEAKELVIRKNTPEIVEKALENYQKELDQIEEKVGKIKEKKSAKVEQFLDKFIDNQIKHSRLIDGLEKKLAEANLSRINELKEKIAEKISSVPLKIENPENLEKRITRIMEKQKGSEFKNFKNLEILKQVEEKVPEQARQAIQKAQENSLKRMKQSIENLDSKKRNKFQYYLKKVKGAEKNKQELLDYMKLKNPVIKKKLDNIKDKDK